MKQSSGLNGSINQQKLSTKSSFFISCDLFLLQTYDRRSRSAMVGEILLVARDRETKTKLIQRANLNQKLANFYLEWLTAQGQLIMDYGKRCSKIYTLTSRGEYLLHLLVELEVECPSLFSGRKARITPSLSSVFRGYRTTQKGISITE